MPVDDFDDLDVLVDGDAFGLDDDEVLVLGVAEVPDEAADTAACAVGELEHDGLPLAWPLVVFLLGLELGLRLGLELGLRLGLELGLRLGLELVLGLLDAGGGLGLPLALELALPLGEALVLALGLALLLLELLLAEVSGAAVVACVRPGAVVVATAVDAGEDNDTHGLGEVTAAAPAGPLDPGPSAVEGRGAGVPPPSGAPALFEELLLPVMAELRRPVRSRNPWRAVGTTDRTRPMANTATPTAKAGRSIASRQSLGRRGSPRCVVRRTSRPRPRRRARPAAKPERPSQTPRAPVGRLAGAGRERILSRIRSRPSVPGST